VDGPIICGGNKNAKLMTQRTNVSSTSQRKGNKIRKVKVWMMQKMEKPYFGH
jgi:hypothetical protein